MLDKAVKIYPNKILRDMKDRVVKELKESMGMPDQPDELIGASKSWLVQHINGHGCALYLQQTMIADLATFIREREDKARTEGMRHALTVIATKQGWEESEGYFSNLLGLQEDK